MRRKGQRDIERRREEGTEKSGTLTHCISQSDCMRHTHEHAFASLVDNDES